MPEGPEEAEACCRLQREPRASDAGAGGCRGSTEGAQRTEDKRCAFRNSLCMKGQRETNRRRAMRESVGREFFEDGVGKDV